jgi:predicted aspartyl protease
MGRIVKSVEIVNPLDTQKRIRCDALVDTGASHMVLPSAWRDRLGQSASSETVEMETADQSRIQGEIAGPFTIEVEGFRRVHGEVMFVDMQPQDGQYEPLIGYIILESIPAAVDMLGHRLVEVKHLDLK